MADLIVRMKKHPDGAASLMCVRTDGTNTWQTPKGAQGFFFAQHDLTHYAVETVLGCRQGFYGLLADGWNITDFGAPWPKGPMPAAALVPELIVGFLDMERASGQRWTAAECNEKARLYAESNGTAIPFALSDEDLIQIRKKRSELFAQWDEVAPGATLELAFDRAVFAR
jgi:hypothetical protein